MNGIRLGLSIPLKTTLSSDINFYEIHFRCHGLTSENMFIFAARDLHVVEYIIRV